MVCANTISICSVQHMSPSALGETSYDSLYYIRFTTNLGLYGRATCDLLTVCCNTMVEGYCICITKMTCLLHTHTHTHTHTQMADFLEGNFLTEQVEAIKELGEHITNLKRVGPGHGEYHFDRKSLK